MKKILLLLLLLAASTVSCSKMHSLGPIGEITADGAIVRGRAFIVIDNNDNVASLIDKTFRYMFIPKAYAYSGPIPQANINITYVNAESVDFTLDTSGLLVNPTLNGGTLELGNFEVATLDDNKLRVCPVGPPPVKCNVAAIRAYTTGSMDGFVNTTDGYSVPLLIGGDTTALNPVNAIDLETYAIPGNMNRLRISDLANTPNEITSDFSNAGAGTYEVVIVVEYVLRSN